ncbi:MAG: T9SS type A sorting domain-containing protein [Candidatus Electryonea clarkiae]|nr:T9SS type A sorting domain-containing protein [Candidatus Electryonea clarkiae]
MFDDFVQDEYESVSVIVYHAYADPWYNINGAEHSARFTYYGVTGIPHCKVDGIIGIHPGTRANLNNAFNQRIDEESPVSINLLTYIDDDGAQVSATITSGDDAVEGNYSIRFALVSLYWDEFTGSNGQDEWHYDLIDMAPDASGLDFEIEANDTEVFDAAFNWPIELDNEDVEEDNAMIVVFIQNDNTREVIQSEMIDLEAGYMFELTTGQKSAMVEPEDSHEFEFTVSNIGIFEDTYDIEVETDLPDGWDFTYTTPDGDQTENSTLTIAEAEQYTSTVTLTSSDVTGEGGGVHFTVSSQALEGLNYTFDFYIQNATPMLVVYAGPNPDYSEFLTSAIETATELNPVEYGLWNTANFELDGTGLEGFEFDAIIWACGDIGTVHEDQISFLDDYVDNGGSLFMSGSDYVQALEATNLIRLMGTNYQETFNGTSVTGFDEDITSHELDFSINGGDGANNRGVPTRLRYTNIMGEVCFEYTEDRHAGVRGAGQQDEYRTLIFGFPFEAIADEESRNTVMTRVLAWLYYNDPAEFDFEETVLEFGEVTGGDSDTLSLVIENISGNTGYITEIELGLAIRDVISFDVEFPVEIGPDADVTIGVIWKPIVQGPMNGRMSVYHNDYIHENPVEVYVSGTALSDVTELSDGAIPDDFYMSQNFPNPFNPTTTIKFGLKENVRTNLSIYNLEGRLVETLVSSQNKAGHYAVEWNAEDLASGVYIISFNAGSFAETKKLMLLK